MDTATRKLDLDIILFFSNEVEGEIYPNSEGWTLSQDTLEETEPGEDVTWRVGVM